MANFKITPATSVFTNSAGDHAFDDDTAGADTLTVDAGAFLITAGVLASGAHLKNTGAWKVTVNGSIVANQYSAITLDQGNAATSTFTIGEDGEVSGDTGMTLGSGITLGSTATIKNAGIIAGTDFGIFISGPGTIATTITNSGTISGGTFSIWDWSGIGVSNDKVTNTGILTGTVDLREGVNTLTNSGRINGAYLGGNGDDTVVNSGFITDGVNLGGGANLLTNSGTIGGHVSLYISSSPNKVTNSGLIIGAISGILAYGDDTVINSGSVDGPVLLGEGNNALTNSGTIGENSIGVSYIGGAGADTVTNSKLITGSLGLGEGTNKLTNSGTIEGDASFGSGADTFINSGTLVGAVYLVAGANILTNSGTIGRDVNGDSYLGGDDADTITNSKSIAGDVFLRNGTNTLTNSGTIGGDIFGGTGVDTIINSGELAGNVVLGDGDDKYTGGNFFDFLKDSNGSETVNLGGGGDSYFAVGAAAGLDGTDVIDGGKGLDTYNAFGATSNLIINLDTVAHGSAAANTAIGSDVAGAFKDTIIGFEDAIGSAAADIIHGSAVANKLQSAGGGGELYGYGGNDTLFGQNGNDALYGGAGRDILSGGLDFDFFVFQSIKDSGPTKATRDVILDFNAAQDFIDLLAIDANTKVAGDQAFTFIGTNVPTGFSGAAGELRAYWSATGQIIEGDVNGDKKADFSIELADPNHLIVLDAGDFLL